MKLDFQVILKMFIFSHFPKVVGFPGFIATLSNRILILILFNEFLQHRIFPLKYHQSLLKDQSF